MASLGGPVPDKGLLVHGPFVLVGNGEIGG